MKRMLTIVVLAIAMSSFAEAQTQNRQVTQTAGVEQELLRVERVAICTADRTTKI